MSQDEESRSNPAPRLRLWPGLVLVAIQWLLWIVVPKVLPEGGLVGVFGGILCGLLVFAWWLFFSRARWIDRLGVLAFMVLAIVATSRLVHVSIAGAMMGNMLYVYSIPAFSLALVAGAAIGRHMSDLKRRVTIAVSILIACGVFTLLRTDGVFGAGSQITWRWSKTAEERLLADVRDEPAAPPSAPATPAPASPVAAETTTTPAALPASGEKAAGAPAAPPPASPVPAPTVVARKPAVWPGFRGPMRDGIVHGVRIDTDWSATPPVALWRRPVGPGWSSFSVDGDLIYTQEQRGDEEVVSCYRKSTGEPVWRHRDRTRFWESNGGAGPRGTPTLANGRVYAFGATGILNALDAATGALIWSRNVGTDTGRRVPDWGFASSPLLVDDVVIVAASGTLAGYDAATGNRRWSGPSRGGSYSSPHRTTIDGVEQILLLSGPGAISVAPATGSVLWEHAWPGTAIVQPALLDGGNVIVNSAVSTGGQGTRRLSISHGSGGWAAEERWRSTGLKPYFNDFVVHKGHAYGFDGSILACIDLEDGSRKWKGGRYGNGQMLLLAEQDVLLILSEEGELALVSATTDQFKELARFQAIDGKTWNHPVLVGDVLLVRNDREMAAFRLKREGS